MSPTKVNWIFTDEKPKNVQSGKNANTDQVQQAQQAQQAQQPNSNTNTTTSLKKSVEGSCGNGIEKCYGDMCCSKNGYCGTTGEYCNSVEGCQGEYGRCNGTSSSSSKSISISSSSKSSIAPTQIVDAAEKVMELLVSLVF
jgi:hypothetical protein